MSVYFIRRKDDPAGLIKIGYTRNVKARVKSLSTATPGGVELLASCAGGARLEHDLHKQLAADRVDGEWFRASESVLAEVAKAKDAPDPFKEPAKVRGKNYLVQPEDEFSPDIVTETRFYLNELVRREWRGAGDTPEEARCRVADRHGISREKARKIWYVLVNSVDGDTYRILSNEYARAMNVEGRAEPRHVRLLAIERFFSERHEAQQIEEANATDKRPSPLGEGMDRAA